MRASHAVAGDFSSGHHACCAPELSHTFICSIGSAATFENPSRQASYAPVFAIRSISEPKSSVTMLTRMPVPASSMAADFVMPSTACLLPTYIAAVGPPTSSVAS